MNLEAPPYARLLGLAEGEGNVLLMPFATHLIGAPGRLHGGAIAGLLELAAHRALLREVGRGTQLKQINITVDFLREGRLEDTQAEGRILKLGRRVANLHAEAWQGDRSRPIAAARMNILVVRASAGD
ncbi:MAG: PaaI family thioesterase [Thermaurantiacus sp.]